jgi:hypothetical protein
MAEHAPPQGPEWLLFDDERDPYQQHNLVYDPDYADVVASLDDLLWERLDEIGDPFHPGVADYVPELGLEEQMAERENWR